ncbi:MAG: TRAP transporter substrate-binding protein DctP [Defluviicoccus sp.]|nr:TRAP transporter substrate-binding protein DctP [Defluviicoccus sp.]MDE0385905.1 TRAP transporter substrate-binding protein DctP [Defluviicoccus sp.]
MRHRPVAGLIAVAAVLAVGLQPSLAAESTVKVVTMLAKKTPIGQSFDGFIARLNQKLEGEFRMDWRGGPEVVPQFKQPNAVRLGSVDATLTSPSYANGILNVSGAANYSNKTYEEIKATGYHDYMAELHAAKGLIYVGEAPVSHLRFHFFLRDPIATLADFKNLKIRVFPAIAPAVKALGGAPLTLPMTEIYTAMERGIVKGFATGVSGVARQYKGLLGAYVEPGFYRATFHFLVNPRAWNKIPAATRAKVIDFVRNVEPPTYEASWNERLKNGYADLGKTGVKTVRFSADEEKKFARLVLEAAWAAVREKAPEEGKRLQSMLMK